MKRTSLIWSLLAAGAALSLTLPATAQQSPNTPADPQKLEKVEDFTAPAVTISPKGREQTITQHREQGKVKDVTVKTGNTSYNIKANDQPGSIQPGEGQSTAIKVPTWKVMEFDLGGHKDKAPAEVAPVPPPAPK